MAAAKSIASGSAKIATMANAIAKATNVAVVNS
jgi:hypothetical protein